MKYSIKDYPYYVHVFVRYLSDNRNISEMFNWCDNNFGKQGSINQEPYGNWFYTIGDGINGYDIRFRFKKQNDFVWFSLTWL